MRFVKIIVFVAIFFFSMLFFVQNTDVLSQTLSLRLNLFETEFISKEFPFYLLVLIAFAVGALLTVAYFFVEKFRTTRQIRQYRHKVANLEKELNSLRNMPLEESGFHTDEQMSDRS
ncbi:MAG: lipopolysaccharide assembly LapA domain-containing protein [Desulfonatronovibrionaceae bacterium]